MKLVNALLNRYRVTSDPLLSERRIELAALVLTAILVLQLLYSLLRLSFASVPQSILPAAESLLVGELHHSGLVTAQQSNDLRARPIFWPSRRPVSAVAEEVEKQPKTAASKSKLDKVKLVGVFGGGDAAGVIALVQEKKRRILLGDKVEGWTLESIEGGKATFTNSGRRSELLLKPKKS